MSSQPSKQLGNRRITAGRLTLALVLGNAVGAVMSGSPVAFSTAVHAQAKELTPGPAAPDDAAWSLGVEASLYLPEGDSDYVLTILSADRGSLHLEGRYQYEDLDTVSAWIGWTWEVGEAVNLEIVPMVGAILGQTNGFALGLEATLSWKRLELYTETEYVLDLEGTEGDYFYSWSELSVRTWNWLRLGVSAQRTRLYRSDVWIEPGIFTAASWGAWELTAYAFDLDSDAPLVILGVGFEF